MEIPDDAVIQFTQMDVAAVCAALDMGMNEARAHRIFRAIVRATKDGDNPIDIAWALAQMLHNVISQQPDGEKATELLRTFITMVCLVKSRAKRDRVH